MEGFHATVREVIDQLATGDGETQRYGNSKIRNIPNFQSKICGTQSPHAAGIDEVQAGSAVSQRSTLHFQHNGDRNPKSKILNLLPGLCSPADIRYLKEILGDFGISGIILPDISETLDAPAQLDYEKIPEGGTPLAAIQGMGSSQVTRL